MTPYQQHKQNWQCCSLCDLSKTRRKVVLSRGSVPCDILFIGEAPGASEDVIGQPFVGPGGRLLERITEEAIGKAKQSMGTDWSDVHKQLNLSFTNLVCCIPKDDIGNKLHEPPKQAIKSCSPRLQEFINLCDPLLVVAVGNLAAKTLDVDLEFISIIHPTAILRMGISQQGLAIQRCVVTLSDAIEEL